VESNVLHMMGPYQERTPGRAPSENVMSYENLNQLGESGLYKPKAVHVPCILDYDAQVMAPGESDSFLDVLRNPRVDSDYWHTPLLTRNPERGVEVATLDRPVGESVGLVVGEFGGTGLIRAPDTVVPVSEDIGTVSCGRVVARGGRWDGADQWLRDF